MDESWLAWAAIKIGSSEIESLEKSVAPDPLPVGGKTVLVSDDLDSSESLISLDSLIETSQLSLLLLKAALDDPQNGCVIFDARLRLLHFTSQVFPLLAIDSQEQPHIPDLFALLSKSNLDAESITAAKNQIHNVIGNGESDPVLLSTREIRGAFCLSVRDIGRSHYTASFKPESWIKPATVKVPEFALTDSLTGLASRPYFEEAVCAALARRPEEPVSVLLLDLDRFKAVNDTLGHAAGDTLLRLAAERLKSAVRKDDLVARLGGDEFAVLLQSSATVDESVSIAKRIMDLVQRTYLIEGQLVNIGTSIGIALSPVDGSDYIKLLRSADLALYHSKAVGRSNFHFFDPQMEQRAQARRTNELELRKALALRQLEVFYQPQVDTKDGRLFGFEALIRWRHPERGLVPPLEFIPLAEQIGLIVSIGEWVLRTACREAMNWPDDVTVAINASPIQFDSDEFVDSVKRALESSGLPGRRLEIEVTEGILLRNDEAVMRILQELQKLEVRIAMDDFGTGYASLSQLAKFPFDKIKIDRSLSGFEGNNLKQRAIVRAITSLGQSLGVCTLAEGVENVEQIDRLKADGCSSVQGYFYGKPVPSTYLSEIISRLHPPLYPNPND